MKVGTTIPNHWGVANVHDVVELAEQAERMHYASVWTMDHLLNVGRVRGVWMIDRTGIRWAYSPPSPYALHAWNWGRRSWFCRITTQLGWRSIRRH